MTSLKDEIGGDDDRSSLIEQKIKRHRPLAAGGASLSSRAQTLYRMDLAKRVMVDGYRIVIPFAKIRKLLSLG